MDSNRVSAVFLNLFILSFPISVSLSQICAAFAIFFHLTGSILKRDFHNRFHNNLFYCFLLLYFSLLISYFWNIHDYNKSFFGILTKSELGDFWLALIFPVSYWHYRIAQERDKIKKAFLISFCILIFSGLISMFTPFRLAPYIVAGFTVPEGQRLQHFAGNILGADTYLPIGLMNTHLTYGGLVALSLPGILIYFLEKFKTGSFWKNFRFFLLISISSIVFFYNQSRSAWMGLCFVLLMYLAKSREKILSQFRILKILLILILVSALFAIGSFALIKKNWLLKRAFQESLESNTTENQRYFIYKNTLDLIAQNLPFGTGPGRFADVHNQVSDKMIEKNEQLWYELYITPRSHAHHDFLHFLGIGGITGALIFLLIWFLFFRRYILFAFTEEHFLFSGIFFMFIAGFFQCYLLDDEVALPFYCFCGLFLGSINSPAETTEYGKKVSKVNGLLYPFLMVFIPAGISLFYIRYTTLAEPETVFKRKIKTEFAEDVKSIRQTISGYSRGNRMISSHASSGFQIEGCLTHRFTSPITQRRNDFAVTVDISSDLNNPPKSVKITAIERDAFDQDRLYRVHQNRILKDFYFNLIQGENKLLFPGILSGKESSKFPENIYFRDFKFYFSGMRNEEFFDLPAIRFGKLCDG